jgi:hypothetical protein
MGLLEAQILQILSKKFSCFGNRAIMLQNLLCWFTLKNETNVNFI